MNVKSVKDKLGAAQCGDLVTEDLESEREDVYTWRLFMVDLCLTAAYTYNCCISAMPTGTVHPFTWNFECLQDVCAVVSRWLKVGFLFTRPFAYGPLCFRFSPRLL